MAIEIGFTGYGMLDGISNGMIHATVDETFTGAAALDADGTFTPDALPPTLTAGA